MAKIIEKIVQSKYPPKDSNVLWDDGENLKISRNGSFENVSDDTDIKNKLTELAEKVGDRESNGGMGYVVLRKDKTFAEQVAKANTIYEVRYDFDLGGQEIAVPSGCALKFNGGKLVNGILELSETIIDSESSCFEGITFSGTTSQIIRSIWFVQFSEFIQLANLSKKGIVDSDWEITNQTPFVLSGTDIDLGGNVITHNAQSTDALFALGNNSKLHHGEIRGMYESTAMSTILLGVESKSSMKFLASNNVTLENLTLRHSNLTWRPNSQMNSSIYIEASGYANVRLSSLDIISARCGVLVHFTKNTEGSDLRWITDMICKDIYISYSEYGFLVNNESEWSQFSGCVFDNIRLVAFSDTDTFDYQNKDSVGFLMSGGPNVFTNITHFNDVGIDHRVWQPTLMHFDDQSKQNIVDNVVGEGYYIEDIRPSGVMNVTKALVYTSFGGIRTSLETPLCNEAINQPLNFEVTQRAVPLQGVESGTREAWFFTTYLLPESSRLVYERGCDEYGEYLDVSLAPNVPEQLVLIRSNGMKLSAFKDRGFAKVVFKLADNNWLPSSSLTFSSVFTTLHAVLTDGSDVYVNGERTAMYDEKNHVFCAFQSWPFGDYISTSNGDVPKDNVEYLYYQIGYKLSTTRSIRVYKDSMIVSKFPIYSNRMVEYVAGGVYKTDDTSYSLVDWDNKPFIPTKYASLCDAYYPDAVAMLCQKDKNIIFESYGSEVKAYYFVGRAKQPRVDNRYEETSVIYNGTTAPSGMRRTYLAFVNSALKKYINGTWTDL